jgi:type VII secretion protein EccE
VAQVLTHDATRTGARAPEPADAWFTPRRQPGRLGPVGLARLLAFEVVQLLVLYVLFQSVWALVAGAVLGALAIVVVFGRSGGRWWTESLGLWLRYRLRLGSAGGAQRDPRLVALSELAPGLLVEDIDGPAGVTVGMGSDGAGWFAALEIPLAAGDGALPPVPLAALTRIAAEAEQSGVVMQVVAHSNPAADGTSREHAVWIVVRLDADAVAQSVIDDPDSSVDVPAVLIELVRRVERLLRKRSLPAGILGADGLVDALTRSCDLWPEWGPARVREDWHAWRSARLSHGCFWLRSWPDHERVTWLLSALREIPTALVSISLLLEPVADGSSICCLVRVAAPADRYRHACDTVVGIADRAGAKVSRLDGQHAPAVYASAPSGGGAR